jgi:hypothetical protein
MQMEPSLPDPHPHIVDKKVNNTLVVMPSPLRRLPRSFSVRANPPLPFSSNPAAAASFACMAPTATDSPPDTPKDVSKPKPKPAIMSAAAFVAFLSPTRLMQRAARAFRSSSSSRSSRRRVKFDARDEQPPLPVTSDVNNNNNGAAPGHQQQDHVEIEPVPAEKIIHEMPNHQPPVAKEAEAREKTTAADDSAADDEPKKAGVLVPVPEEEEDDVADKFCMVVKEAMMKEQHEEEDTTGDDTKKEATRRFQGSLLVKTATPPRREVARSNDMIEEACTRLLAKRQGSRVRALVGAFETVMLDAAKPAVTPNKPMRRHYNVSVV